MSNKHLIDGESKRLPKDKKTAPVTKSSSVGGKGAVKKPDAAEPSMPAENQALVSEVPVDDQRYSRMGLIFLLVTLGTFSLWAGFAPLSSALVTSGEVVVDSYRKSIQHYEGGIVKNIYVRNGDLVAAGDPLIQLDTTQVESEYDATRTRLFSTMAELERLRAEQGLQKQLQFSERLQAEADQDTDIAGVLSQQKQLHTASVGAFMQEQNALDSRLDQIEEQIAGLERQQPILNAQIESLRTEKQAFATLFAEGLGDNQRARELDRQVLQKQNELASNESEVARLRIQLSETEQQKAQRRQDYLKATGEQLKRVQGEYFDLKEKLNIAEDRLSRSTIRAPEPGVVVDMQVHTIGSVAPSGKTLLDLVPEKDKYVVEARVMTRDINDLYKGQLADIRFSAFNQRTTKVIEGEVVHVSADRLLNEKDGSPYYLARVKVTEQGLQDMTEEMALRPGMPAEVMIRRGERTLFSYLLKPIADGFARGLKEK